MIKRTQKLVLFLCLLLPYRAFTSVDYTGVTPIFLYGEWDRIKAYTNLYESSDNMTLELDNYSKGIRVNTRRKIGMSAGLASEYSEDFNDVDLSQVIGIAPSVKTNADFVNYVEDIKSAEKLIQFIPYNENELDKYKILDSAQFEFLGGVVFNLGLQSGIYNAGLKGTLHAGWSCSILKIDEQNIFIELKKLKEIGNSLYVNATIPNAEIGRYKQNISGASFIINYKSPEGIQAYNQFLLGRIDKITESENNVMQVKDFNSIKKSQYKSMGLAIPYVPFLQYTTTHEIQSITTDEKIFDESINTKKYALSLKKREINIFGRKKIIETSFLVSEDSNKFEMQYYFKEHDNHSTSKNLLHIKKILANMTGLSDFLEFKIKDNEKLKFAEIKLSLTLGSKIIDSIKNKSEKIISYLRDIKSTDENENKIIEDYIDQSQRIRDQVETKELAKIGQKVWSSKELFKAQYKLVRDCGGEVAFEVSGKRISRLLRKEVFSLSKNCPL
jgi:hypothetical protein